MLSLIILLLVLAGIAFLVSLFIGGFEILRWASYALAGLALLFLVVTYADDVWNWVFDNGEDTVACYYPATGNTVSLDEDVCVASGGQTGSPTVATATVTTSPTAAPTQAPAPTPTPVVTAAPDPAPTQAPDPSPTQAPVVTPAPTQVPAVPVAQASCQFPGPGNLDDMPKTVIELAPQGQWFHRVFNERLFHAPDWGGADSWFVSLAIGSNSGGAWTDFNNPGQIIYRGTQTHITWCLGVLTSSQYKDQFLAGSNGPAAVNVRIAPHSVVTVTGPSGTQSQATSDAGDITIILPDSGMVVIAVDYSTAAPTHESHVWWGPYDRSEHINTIDAR